MTTSAYTSGSKSCIVSGSFDPIHNGHIWLINKAKTVFDQVFVLVSTNEGKSHLLDVGQRVALVKACLPGTGVAVLPKGELLAPYCREHGIFHQVRGIRTLEDYGYELKLHQVNKLIAPEFETVFFLSPPELNPISSSTLKALMKLKAGVEESFAPKIVLDTLREVL